MDVNNESAASCAAREYARRGWAPIPVPFKGKNPGDKRAGGYGSEWEDARIDENEVSQFWNGRPQNVGVILGEASDGLIDIDLDAPETIALAPHFLYATPLAFGRKSKPKSHWLFRCSGELPKTLRLKMPAHGDDRGGATLVEFRANGGQTIFPGSVHESGEQIEWCGKPNAEPYEIDSEELLRHVHHLAAAAVLVKLWPYSGSRHDAALALAGLMFQVGLPKDEANKIMHAVAMVAGDEERQDRVTCVESTYQKADRGEAVAGGGALAEIIGDKAASKVKLWLGYGATVRSSWLERESAANPRPATTEPQSQTQSQPKAASAPKAARGLEWVSQTLGFNISRIEKMVNERPSYRLITDRGEILLENVHQLADFHSFKKQVAAHANHIIPAKAKILWDDIAQAMLDNRVDVAIGDDAGDIGSLKERIEEYCAKKKVVALGEETKKNRDTAMDFGQPWVEEGCLVFRGSAFLKFLKTEYFENLTPKCLGERIRRMGGDVGKAAYAASTRNVMKVPLTELSIQVG